MPPAVACAAAALVVLLGGGAAPARAAAGPDTIAVDHAPAAPGELAVRRAAFAWRSGDPAGVVDALEGLDFTRGDAFADADRAAYLLARAHLALGERSRFVALARVVEAWPTPGPYGLAIAFERLLLAPGDDADRARLLALVAADTTTPAGRDRAAAAILVEATRAIERGADPRVQLAAMPAGSRHAARALHLSGLVALEKGERDEARRLLAAALAADSMYADRADVELALAGDALDRGAWAEAETRYGASRARRDAALAAIARLVTGGDFAPLWQAWSGADPLADEVALDLAAPEAEARERAWRASDWTARPAAPAAAAPVVGPADRAGLARLIAPPGRAERDSVDALGHAADEAAAAYARVVRAAAAERARLVAERHYFAFGAAQVDAERRAIAGRAAVLDSLEARLGAVLAQLTAVRDAATRRLLERGARVLAACRDQRTWIAALRRLHVDGPARQRAVPPPAGHVDPDSLTRAEDALARAVDAAAAGLVALAPGRIARSFDEAWKPGLLDRTRRLGVATREDQDRAARLAGAIDGRIETLATSDTLRALEALALARAAEASAAAAARDALKGRVARSAADRSAARLAAQGEGLDYGLAAAAYGAWVTAAAADSLDGPETAALRGPAMARAQAFLAAYDSSGARGEVRFRLADLHLAHAREDFRMRMAAYLAAASAGRNAGALPVLDHAPALVLYQAILAGDPGFAHRDAVLFNAGTILVEGGDPAAGAMFETLVKDHAGSPFAQESWLRLADLRFEQRAFAEAIPFYEKASAGADARLRVIALYKKAWASFNEDGFLAAAESFRAVLDEYAAARAPDAAGARSLEVDVEKEAESYLVHSLARAGGAAAFARTFDPAAPRAYEPRVLLALGQHFRAFSLYAPAIEVDSLYLERHGDGPDALVAAERQAETARRWNRPELARRHALGSAGRFAPGGAWAEAQAEDSLRSAGARFARAAWMDAAAHHHHANEWREALAYERRLLAAWPADAEAPRWRLLEGEAHVGLGDEAAALAAFDAAASSGRDSLPEIALARKVAVIDAGYERSRRGGAGDEARARAVLAAGDALLVRAPGHRAAADVRWRQANLAFAHGWNDRAIEDFGRLAEQHPADRRAPDAASLKADAFFRLEKFDAAEAAFAVALATSRSARRDSLARRAEAALPVCAFRHAESIAAGRDSSDHARHAPLFARVAERWPAHELAPIAQYRAAQAWLAAGERGDGVRAMEALIARFPRSEFVRDAHLAVAAAEDSARAPERAAAAYERFARAFPADDDADEAWLRSAALYADAGREAKSDSMRLAYGARHPGDAEGAMEALETIVRRDLARLGDAAAAAKLPATARAPLAAWRERAAKRPDLASRDLAAQLAFREAEELAAPYDAARLTLPLKKSLPARKKALEALVARHRACVELGVTPWASASAFRIGEAVAAFGDALLASERPADLAGDDLAAYDEVIAKEARPFHQQGERAWSELLAAAAAANAGTESPAEPWLARARTALWPRLAQRFLYRPEFELSAGVDSALAATSRADFTSGAHAAAIERLEAARVDATPATLLVLALHYDAAERPVEAGAVLAEAIAAGAEGGSAEVYLRLRGAAPDRAAGPAREALKRGPERAVNHNNDGVVRLRGGDVAGADAAFRKAAELDPALPGPYYNRALLERFYRFDEGAAARFFALYRERAADDPDGLADALRGDGVRQAAAQEVSP